MELFGQCWHLVHRSENTFTDCLSGVNADSCLLWCLFKDFIGAPRVGFLYFLYDTGCRVFVKGFLFFDAFCYRDSFVQVRCQLLLELSWGSQAAKAFEVFRVLFQYVFLCEFPGWGQVSFGRDHYGFGRWGCCWVTVQAATVGLVRVATLQFLVVPWVFVLHDLSRKCRGCTVGLSCWVAWVWIGLWWAGCVGWINTAIFTQKN